MTLAEAAARQIFADDLDRSHIPQRYRGATAASPTAELWWQGRELNLKVSKGLYVETSRPIEIARAHRDFAVLLQAMSATGVYAPRSVGWMFQWWDAKSHALKDFYEWGADKCGVCAVTGIDQRTPMDIINRLMVRYHNGLTTFVCTHPNHEGSETLRFIALGEE